MNQVDAYIEAFPEDVQKRLRAIRQMVKEEAPEATERFALGMPTYNWNDKWFFHFAAFKKHIGVYPQPAGIKAFEGRLAEYKTSKGTVQFPLSKPLPEDLIRDIIRTRAAEERAK